jgi:hypothetical protein
MANDITGERQGRLRVEAKERGGTNQGWIRRALRALIGLIDKEGAQADEAAIIVTKATSPNPDP